MIEKKYGMSEMLNILCRKFKNRGYKIFELSPEKINKFTMRGVSAP